jgi:hypothetical protein
VSGMFRWLARTSGVMVCPVAWWWAKAVIRALSRSSLAGVSSTGPGSGAVAVAVVVTGLPVAVPGVVPVLGGAAA